MKLSEVSVKRPVLAAMMIGALVVFGLFAYPKLAVDIYPSVDFPVVTATVVYPGADPGTMESKVAEPIEEALQGISGIKRLTSRNLESVTSVIVEFELEVDGNLALQDVRDKISAIEGDLPSGIDPPVIQKFDTGAAPVMSVALSSTMDIRKLTQIADKVVKQELQQVQGVGSINMIGGREREIHILVDAGRLASYGMTVDDVRQAIQIQNLDMPAGRVHRGDKELSLTVRGEVDTVEGIADILISGLGGAPVRIRDVAKVVDTMEEARSASFLNGESALALVVMKQSGANTVEIANDLRKLVEKMRPKLLEEGIAVAIPTDNSDYIQRAIDDVQVDLVIGSILTVFIIWVFLHDPRATFISAMAIPTSVIGTFAFMQMMDFSLDNISMLALSLSIGILVDDAIVVLENIHRHLELGKGRRRAALDATKEIGFAVIATTASIVAVFIPVAYMDGIIGRFFFEFGLTVSACVIISTVVSLSLTPMLASRMLKISHEGQKKNRVAAAFDRVFERIENGYEVVIRWALGHPKTTLMGAFLTLVASIFVVAQVPGEFIPPEDRAEFAITVETPTGTALERTSDVALAVATDVRENLPGVLDTFTTIGGGTDAQPNRARINVSMVGGNDRAFHQSQAMSWVRQRVAGIEDAKIAVEMIDPLSGGGGGFRTQQIQFTMRGGDLELLVEKASELKAALDEIPGFVDLDITYRGGKPELIVEVDRDKAAQLGVPVAVAASSLRALMAGDSIADFKSEGEVYDVVLQLDEEDRDRIDRLENVRVRSTSGELVALSDVLRFDHGEGPSEIERQNRMRQVTLLGDVDTLPLAEATQIIEAKAKEILPSSIRTGWVGNAEMMAESFIAMLAALGLAIILVYMILAAQFDSLMQPLIIMVSLPLSVIGAFGAIYLTGMTLNIFTFIGVIMLMGLVTKAAILLLDFTNAARADGMELTKALVEAGRVRLRPIVMTTAATVFGMLPIAMALSEGGAVRAPMAVCVIGGMITSTLLTLVVIPVVYLLADRFVTHRSMQWILSMLGGGQGNDEPESDTTTTTEG